MENPPGLATALAGFVWLAAEVGQRERAARLRAIGEAAHHRHLERLAGSAQSVLVERPGLGRTEDFTLASLAGGTPGEIVEVVVAGHDGARLITVPPPARAA